MTGSSKNVIVELTRIADGLIMKCEKEKKNESRSKVLGHHSFVLLE